MRPNEIQTLFEYTWWTSDLLLNKASEITTEQFVAGNGLPHGSIRGTFQHTLMALHLWRQRTEFGVSPTEIQYFEDLETIDALRERYTEERAAWGAYLEALTEDALTASISYKNTKGVPATKPLWLILSHVVNHSTQHHSEIAQELTVLGYSPGGIDLIYFAIQQGA